MCLHISRLHYWALIRSKTGGLATERRLRLPNNKDLPRMVKLAKLWHLSSKTATLQCLRRLQECTTSLQGVSITTNADPHGRLEAYHVYRYRPSRERVDTASRPQAPHSPGKCGAKSSQLVMEVETRLSLRMARSHQSPSRLKELPGPLSTRTEFLLSHIIVLDTVNPSWQRRHIPRASIDPQGAMSRRMCDHDSLAWVPMAAANLSL